MIKILVCGNYGATNLGDEAILSGICSIFSGMSSDVEVAALGPNGEAITDLHGCEASNLFPAGLRSLVRGLWSGSIWKTIDAVRNADLVVIGGGGLFTDEKIMAVVIWSLQVAVVKMLRKPYICIGQSVGPLRTTFGRLMSKRVFKSSHLNIVRDAYSARLLNILGIEGVVALSDCAFKLHSPESTVENEDPFIVMTIRPWPADNINRYQSLAEFIDYIHKTYKLKTVLVPFQILKDDDSKELQKVMELVKRKDAVSLLDYQSDFNDVLNLFGKATAVVGMRLHSLIFSTLARKPFLALSYSTKVEEFVKQIGMADFLIRWNDLNFYELKSKFDRLMNSYLEVTENVEQGSLTQRNKVQEYASLIGNITNIRK